MPIMNSDGVRAGATITDIRRKRAKPAGDKRFTLAAGVKPAAEAMFGPAVVSVTSLLSIQETPEADGEAARAESVRRGDDLLDRLDELRVALLAGVVPRNRLAVLAETLKQDRRMSGDERLDHLIGEIELRVKVEAAKLARWQ